MKEYQKTYRDLILYNPPTFDSKNITSFDGDTYESKSFIAYRVEYKIKYSDKDEIYVSGYDFITEKDAEIAMISFFDKLINELDPKIANKHLQTFDDGNKTLEMNEDPFAKLRKDLGMPPYDPDKPKTLKKFIKGRLRDMPS
jgi:hypothetical protein